MMRKAYQRWALEAVLSGLCICCGAVNAPNGGHDLAPDQQPVDTMQADFVKADGLPKNDDVEVENGGADVSVDAQDAVDTTEPGKCTMDTLLVDCSIALWDIAIAEAGASNKSSLTGLTPRTYCEKRCSAPQPDGIVSGDWLLYDKGACAHSTSIKELKCLDCKLLRNDDVPLRCDNDPCTRDWCEGSKCLHVPHQWVGFDCSISTCNGKFVCNPSGCASDTFCNPKKLQKCVPCE